MQSLDNIKRLFEKSLLLQYDGREPRTLNDPIQYLLRLGGKRIRPVLLIKAYELYSDQLDAAMPAAQAVELFHNFSLMHDDIMDDANLRRGKPTVHELHGTNQAILSGDAMLIHAYQALQSYSDQPFYADLMQFFSDIALGVCEGQQYDMDFEVRDNVTIPEYVRMIEYKTAILFGASMKMGAMVAGASADDQRHLYEFGRNLGIAFQLLDDYLDCYGESHKVGKKKGGDILQSKKTYLHLKTLELLDESAKEAYLDSFISLSLSDEYKIKCVMQYYRDVNAGGYLMEMKEAYTQLATSHLAAVSVKQSKYQGLYEYLIALAKRTS